MTIHQFNLLNEAEKQRVIWTDGVFLAKHTEGNFVYDVYQIEGFYVEISYRINSEYAKSMITALSDPDDLLFLDKMNVADYLR
jgi:hypothetical protein